MSGRVRRSSQTRNQALRRLFVLQEFSMANYASQAQLYVGDEERNCLAVILEIAKHQSKRAAEIGNLLAARRALVLCDGFAMHLTGLNDVSASFVARRMLIQQPELIAAIHHCVDQLHGDYEGQALARQTAAGEEKNLRQLKHLVGDATDAADSLRAAA